MNPACRAISPAAVIWLSCHGEITFTVPEKSADSSDPFIFPFVICYVLLVVPDFHLHLVQVQSVECENWLHERDFPFTQGQFPLEFSGQILVHDCSITAGKINLTDKLSAQSVLEGFHLSKVQVLNFYGIQRKPLLLVYTMEDSAELPRVALALQG